MEVEVGHCTNDSSTRSSISGRQTTSVLTCTFLEPFTLLVAYAGRSLSLKLDVRLSWKESFRDFISMYSIRVIVINLYTDSSLHCIEAFVILSHPSCSQWRLLWIQHDVLLPKLQNGGWKK